MEVVSGLAIAIESSHAKQGEVDHPPIFLIVLCLALDLQSGQYAQLLQGAL
jgi:hypothetical protein